MRATQLFARSQGLTLSPGDESCFWCGYSCDQSHAVKMTDTFWDWDVVANRQSRFECAGCVEARASDREMIGRDKLQRTWTYSWLLTETTATPWTKADVAAMRETCLNPPAAPWSLSIAESGQKHILFRTPVNTSDTAPFVVQLELVTVTYYPCELSARIDVCNRVAAACGKPSLEGRLELSQVMRVADHHGDEAFTLSDWWERFHNEPITRLAAFLSLNMEDAKLVYPSITPAKTGRAGVPKTTGGTGGRGGERSLFS